MKWTQPPQCCLHYTVNRVDGEHDDYCKWWSDQKILAAIIDECGVSSVNTGEKCPHDRYGYEECEQCYRDRILKRMGVSDG